MSEEKNNKKSSFPLVKIFYILAGILLFACLPLIILVAVGVNSTAVFIVLIVLVGLLLALFFTIITIDIIRIARIRKKQKE